MSMLPSPTRFEPSSYRGNSHLTEPTESDSPALSFQTVLDQEKEAENVAGEKDEEAIPFFPASPITESSPVVMIASPPHPTDVTLVRAPITVDITTPQKEADIPEHLPELHSEASVLDAYLFPSPHMASVAHAHPTIGPELKTEGISKELTAPPPQENTTWASLPENLNQAGVLSAPTPFEEVSPMNQMTDTPFEDTLSHAITLALDNGAPHQTTDEITRALTLNPPALQDTPALTASLAQTPPTVFMNVTPPPSHTANALPTATIVENHINPSVYSSQWDKAFGERIHYMVMGGHQSASLTLHPADLGPLQVVIQVHNQLADASFISHQPEVRLAIENALPKLRDMLEQSGIQLGQCHVGSESSQQQPFMQYQPIHRPTALGAQKEVHTMEPSPTTHNSMALSNNGRVDIFA